MLQTRHDIQGCHCDCGFLTDSVELMAAHLDNGCEHYDPTRVDSSTNLRFGYGRETHSVDDKLIPSSRTT